MTAASQQIVTAYSNLGLTIEQIVEQFGFDATVVKSVLQQFCPEFRKDAKKDETLRYTQDEGEEAKAVLMDLMRYSEDENIRYKAATRVYDEAKGRLDVQQIAQGLNINVIQFNEQLDKVRKARQRTQAAAVDIEAAKKLVAA